MWGAPLSGRILQRAPQEQCRCCAGAGPRAWLGPQWGPILSLSPVLPLPLVPTGVGLESPTQEDPAALEEV